ncbi:unnamed protein product [Rotaria magnacalcarata]|uniref:protein O-GlcNAcase n=1 Tax=Rotaria magnacalcarata TaxID=392030 RepID=A0A815QJ70_9BILA|nr:unnamed protein product [Rotaria magnacalcarata]CAF1960517.1 unnamed protein product [Rotaria magnacalcarata]CAF2069184.1 unnamed protein product [Rotaria magnacalcarata]CAF3972951.1 unnamed protein product [Rotaria magnacalcarata]CAF4197473.1 unnamed protein product [Rotaria magnacalcarata]
MKKNYFLCGIIEGYYGRPWSLNQRKILFETCLRFGLNAYVYAPKDDAKHRSRWRDLYTNDELNELRQLIHIAKQCEIYFIYALSPGLDISYSSEKDLLALKRKFDQLSSVGCEHWSLLFDDIENEMSQEDKNNFPSFAHAHVSLTNQLYEYLKKPNIFLFCPTVYCSRMAVPSLDKSSYLQTIGDDLHPDIDIFWTGPKVVSRQITISHILSVNNLLKRCVTIWDNLNANDYDQRRLCMGPFSGRSLNLSSHICGILSNPNCEFELNFVPLNTLSQWFQSIKLNEKHRQYDNDENDTFRLEIYQVDKALNQSLIDWLPEFNKIKSANYSQEIIKIDNSPEEMNPKGASSSSLSLINDEDSQDSINENQMYSSSSKTHKMECDQNSIHYDLTIDDIRLLVELFYLPYQHGPNVQQIFMEFYWLRYNYNPHQNLDEWRCRAQLFHNNAKNISRLLEKLIKIQNRALLYDVYNYINDMNSTIILCSKYLHWIDDDQKRSLVFMSGDIEPWSKRGGIAGDFLDILPLGDFQSLIKSDLNSLSNTFIIRAMTSNDQSSIYDLCSTVCYQDDLSHLLNQHSHILADKIIGGYVSSSLNNNNLCFVIENDQDKICGFLLTINESEKYDKYIQTKWIEQLHEKYPDVDQNFFELIECPQWIYDRYSVRIQIFIDSTMNKNNIYYLGTKLMKILIKNLSQQGFRGCHTLVDERFTLLHKFYLNLGFIDIPIIDQNNQNILLGKQF